MDKTNVESKSREFISILDTDFLSGKVNFIEIKAYCNVCFCTVKSQIRRFWEAGQRILQRSIGGFEFETHPTLYCPVCFGFRFNCETHIWPFTKLDRELVRQAYAWSRSRIGGWAIAQSPILSTTITIECLKLRGYIPLLELYNHIKPNTVLFPMI